MPWPRKHWQLDPLQDTPRCIKWLLRGWGLILFFRDKIRCGATESDEDRWAHTQEKMQRICNSGFSTWAQWRDEHQKKRTAWCPVSPNAKFLFEVELLSIDGNRGKGISHNETLALKLIQEIRDCYWGTGRLKWKLQGIKTCLLDPNIWKMQCLISSLQPQIFYYNYRKY